MINKINNTFHLQGKSTSYIMAVNEYGDLIHYYFGKKLRCRDYSGKINSKIRTQVCLDENDCSLEAMQQEYPAYGHTDLRGAAYCVKNKYGNTVSRLLYKGYSVKENAVAYVEGMPSLLKGENTAQTLEITLCDEKIGLEVVLSYTVFDEYDIVARSSKIVNNSDADVCVETAYSASVDFPKADYDFIYFPGAWCREREFVRTQILPGAKLDASNARGGSGHAMNPFVMVASRNATEKYGDVYGFSLIYSGNHSTTAECDVLGGVRIRQGINPQGFEAVLGSGESFYTPQSVICYSSNGFGGVSRQLNDIYRSNICRSNWAKKDRPVLINNWEGTYFDFTEEKLLSLAKKAKSAGLELFVLDDGWFGKRDNDRCSLGDWFVNKNKLPSGVKGLAEKINKEGLEFGLWFEPEMVNPDSDLYRKHLEWAISVPNITPACGRNQYILDLSNNEVCDFVIKSVSDILENANIVYVKWDYNRNMSDMPCKGYNHKYILGLYKVLDTLINRFPDVLFEGCASGGGRFDPGILAYSPQIWTSDNSDAISRLKIQYSTSMCYPLSTISAHVTASPNHQVGRITSLKTRAAVAYAGIFGYELDITQMSGEELSEIEKQVEFYKQIRNMVRTGDFYRLQSPYEGNYCSWQIVSKDKTQALLIGCKILSVANSVEENIVLDGLCEQCEYVDSETGEIFGGDELMQIGIKPVYENNDFAVFVKLLKMK